MGRLDKAGCLRITEVTPHCWREQPVGGLWGPVDLPGCFQS